LRLPKPRYVSVSKETYLYAGSVKRDLSVWQKRPVAYSMPAAEEGFWFEVATAEVCVSVTRDLFKWQKRPVCMAKEACLYGKRDLSVWQKRPIEIRISEVCVSVKRDLIIWQKRPVEHSIPAVRLEALRRHSGGIPPSKYTLLRLLWHIIELQASFPMEAGLF